MATRMAGSEGFKEKLSAAEQNKKARENNTASDEKTAERVVRT